MKWTRLLKEVSMQEILEFVGLSEEEVLEILFEEGYIKPEDIEAFTPLTVVIDDE